MGELIKLEDYRKLTPKEKEVLARMVRIKETVKRLEELSKELSGKKE